MSPLILIAIGVVGGFASGILGIGGGTILVPLLIMFVGLSQHHAQGTTLAMLCLPAGLAAAYQYQQKGFVDWRMAVLLFCGFVAGSYFGGGVAVWMPQRTLQRIFGITLLVLGGRMLLQR
jgi:uncharacterized membrane protein YfcA